MLTWQSNESVKNQLASHAGNFYGVKPTPAEGVVLAHGDFLLALGYAALFFPEISIIGGIPHAKFTTADVFEPIECVHIDLLHHDSAAGRNQEVYLMLGAVLSSAWNQILRNNNLNGHFEYDQSTGFDLVFKP